MIKHMCDEPNKTVTDKSTHMSHTNLCKNIPVSITDDNNISTECNTTISETQKDGFSTNLEHEKIVARCRQHKLYSYDSDEGIKYMRELINNGMNITLNKFINRNVIYLALIAISDSNNHIIVKIGFTCNILEKLKALKQTYQAKVILLDIRFANTIVDKNNLHAILHLKYPDCVHNYIIDGESKKELYVLTDGIVNEFLSINPILNEGIDMANRHSSIIKLIMNCANLDDKTKCEYLMTLENNAHTKYIVDAKIKQTQLELVLLDKQIILAQLNNK